MSDAILRKNVLMGFIMRVMNFRFGTFYSLNYSTEILDGDKVMFCSRSYSTARSQVVSPNYTDRTAQFYSVPNPFVVVVTRNHDMYLISNPGMIRVMRCIADGSAAIQDIAAATEMPEITVHSVISRLESIGVVECQIQSRSMVYGLSSKTLVRAVSTPAEPPPPVAQGELQFTKSFFSNTVYRYLLWVADSFAIGSSAMFHAAGCSVARLLMRKLPSIAAQDFIDHMCRVFSGDGVDISLESYIPVHLVFNSGMQDSRFGDHMRTYLQALVTECLRIITGDEYRVIIDINPINRADFQTGIKGI